MSYKDLPPLPPALTPGGRAYAFNVMARSKLVLESECPAHLDCAYGSDYWQKVDVFPPLEHVEATVPVFLFAHGGSWISGCKEWMAFMAPALRTLPLVFISVSYRLAPTNRFPDPLDDCADALRWAYDHADRWRGNRAKIFVGGHSAGGHLMSLLSLRPELLERRGLPTDLIKGCVAVSTPFSISESLTGTANAVLEQSRQLLLRDPKDAMSASPMSYVKRGAPQFSISVGQNDFAFIREQAPAMKAALEAKGNTVNYQELAGHDHFATSERSVDADHPWLTAVATMMDIPGIGNKALDG